MNRLIILPLIIASILYSKEDKVIVSINGLESAGLSKRYINYAQYTIQEISIDLEEAVSKMIGDKYSIDIHFTAYESVENTINVAKDSLNKIIKTIKDKYPDEGLVTHIISHPYKGIQGVIIGTVQIQVDIDNSINLDNISSEIFDWIFMDLQDCRECISFNNVDMDSINGKNTILLTRDDIYDDSWAVIIGIDNYQNLSNLDYAVADAEAVKALLIGKFDYPEENVKLLLNEEANKANIVNVISDVSLKAGENDRILVFYAGHGETMPLPEGGEMGYLVPIDGNQDNLFASAIPMGDLKDLCYMSKAKHMLFLVDACYGGLAAVGSRGLEPAKTPNYIGKITNIKSRQIITAGGKDEKVFEKSEWGHSAYTKNLLSALEDGYADSNEDGYITADELGDYLSEKVSIDSENQQTPQSRRLTSHEGEFIFIANNEINQYKNNSDNEIDYDILAEKITEKLKTDKDIERVQSALTKTNLNDKPRSINIGLGSQRSITYLSISQNIKSWEHNTLFLSTGIGATIIGIGLSNKTLNLNGIIGLDGSFLNSKSKSFIVTYFVSYTKQANLKRNWLFDYGLGFGNYKSEDDSKIEHTVFPIISFEYIF